MRVWKLAVGSILGGILGASLVQLAWAGQVKVWQAGEVVQPGDLNTVIAHLHNNMVGGHGARLVNADISTSAAIAHSKFATPALVPKAWAVIGAASTPCDGAAALGTDCVTRVGSQVTIVEAKNSAGVYGVNLGYNPADANFMVLVKARYSAADEINCRTNDTTYAAGTGDVNLHNFEVDCYSIDTNGAPVATNAVFEFAVFDN